MSDDLDFYLKMIDFFAALEDNEDQIRCRTSKLSLSNHDFTAETVGFKQLLF